MYRGKKKNLLNIPICFSCTLLEKFIFYKRIHFFPGFFQLLFENEYTLIYKVLGSIKTFYIFTLQQNAVRGFLDNC